MSLRAATRAHSGHSPPARSANRDKGFPHISRPVLQRHDRLGVRQLRQDRRVSQPRFQLVSHALQGGPVSALPEGLDRLAGLATTHPDVHSPVGDGVRQATDPRQRGHREGGEQGRLLRRPVTAQSGLPSLEAGIEQAAQILVVLRDPGRAEDRVHLVEEQRRRMGDVEAADTAAVVEFIVGSGL